MRLTPQQQIDVKNVLDAAEAHIERMTGIKEAKLAMYTTTAIEPKSPTMMLAIIAEELGMSYADYAEKKRDGDIVDLRRVACVCLAHLYVNLTPTEIGRLIGKIDTRTVQYHIETGIALLQNGTDDVFTDKYKRAYNKAEQWQKGN